MSAAAEPDWLDIDNLIAAHDATIAAHRELPSVRDPGALESAVSRPLNKWTYGETDIVVLAAAYDYGLARNHAFSDGNKRIAYIAIRAFVERNGFRLIASAEERIATFLALAGEPSEDALANWLRSRAQPV